MAKKKTSTARTSGASKAKGGASAAGKGASKKKTASKKAPAKKAAGAGKKTAARTTKKTGGAASKKAATGTKKKPAATQKKAPAAKTTRKSSAKKTTTKKPGGKKTSAKKPAAGKTTKKAPTKKNTTKKAGSKKAPAKTPAAKQAETPAAPPAPPPPPATSGGNTSGSDNKPARPSRPKRPKPPAAVMPEGIGGLLSPGGPARKPLIASSERVAAEEAAQAEKYPTKSPFNKRELEKFRQVLLQKRNEVLSEVTGLEGGALTSGGSGNLSHTPQHMADAGSDAADQTLSLDLAAAERNLIKEIDAALKRIADGVFGLCVATGKPIRKERLQELPWARYSIDAARQLEGKR
ncbi:MAG: hypothetical protein RIE32_13760 [Phycisphaerales bacterium]